MATQILTRDGDKRLVLSGSHVARQFNAGTWTRLRVGIRLAVMGPTMTVSYPHLTLGLCSGAVNIYPNNCHFAGIQTNTASTWSMQTTYVNGFSGTGAAARHRLVKKVGAVASYGADSDNTGGGRALGGTTYSNNCSMFGLEFEKTTGLTWTLRPFTVTSLLTTHYVDELSALAAMELGYGLFGALQYHGYYRNAETIAVDEGADGVLDTLNIAWDQTPQTIEILGAYVARLA